MLALADRALIARESVRLNDEERITKERRGRKMRQSK
jgi:hypothetical protein